MYNSEDLIVDGDLTFLSYGQSINRSFRFDELLESPLWHIIDCNGYYKCIPLFNCDIINSSNPLDNILDDNKCLISSGEDMDAVISCVSDDTGGIHYHRLVLDAFAPYNVLDLTDSITVYCLVYDEYLNTLNNVSVDVLVDDELVSQVLSDNQGLARFSVKASCSVMFRYDGVLSDVVEVL